MIAPARRRWSLAPPPRPVAAARAPCGGSSGTRRRPWPDPLPPPPPLRCLLGEGSRRLPQTNENHPRGMTRRRLPSLRACTSERTQNRLWHTRCGRPHRPSSCTEATPPRGPQHELQRTRLQPTGSPPLGSYTKNPTSRLRTRHQGSHGGLLGASSAAAAAPARGAAAPPLGRRAARGRAASPTPPALPPGEAWRGSWGTRWGREAAYTTARCTACRRSDRT
mmetsp:Transcript_7818/g.14809  ORF Transcript_7818/g.14809 Transcript_7818/m.14809 type:complete len:222 (-) Transcript_7818:1263-1928(-)